MHFVQGLNKDDHMKPMFRNKASFPHMKERVGKINAISKIS